MEHRGKNCGACTSAQVQSLFCELLDPGTSPQRANDIRAHIAECDECQDRLEREELVRQLLSKCCSHDHAPQQLRQRISVEITRMEIRY